MEKEQIWNIIINYGITTEEELKLITDINGFSTETLNDVNFIRTEHRDISQFLKYQI